MLLQKYTAGQRLDHFIMKGIRTPSVFYI